MQGRGECCLWVCYCVFIFLASVPTLCLVCLFSVCHSYEMVNSLASIGLYIVVFWLVWRELWKAAFVKYAIMVKFGFHTISSSILVFKPGFDIALESTLVWYRSEENLVNLYLNLLVESVYSVRGKYFRTHLCSEVYRALIPVTSLQFNFPVLICKSKSTTLKIESLKWHKLLSKLICFPSLISDHEESRKFVSLYYFCNNL